MINERLFGSPIPLNVRKKLEDRQTVAGKVAPGESIPAVFPDRDGNNQADLSSRTPFVRMWTSMRLIDPAVIFENPPQAEKITKELLERNDINYSGDIDFEVAQKLVDKVKQNSENLLRGTTHNNVLKDVVYKDPRVVESRAWYNSSGSKESMFFIVGNISRDQLNYARKTYIIGDVNYQQYYNAVSSNNSLEQETTGIIHLEGGKDYIKGLPRRRANLMNLQGGPIPTTGIKGGAPIQHGKHIKDPKTGKFKRGLRKPPPMNFGLGLDPKTGALSTSTVSVSAEESRAGYAGNPDTTAPGGFKQELSYNPLLKPLAGITSVSSETDGSLGVIKKTVVNFKVNNFYDFDDIFNRFFLKPGATVFIDFGWSSISDLYNPNDLLQAYNPDEAMNYDSMNNNKGSQLGVTSSPLVNMYEKLYYEPDQDNPDDLKPEGIVTRENGDLEVLQGIVTDYSSKINKDGTVDCSVTLTSSNSALLNSNTDPMMASKIASLLRQGILLFGLLPTVDDRGGIRTGKCVHPNQWRGQNSYYDPNKDPLHKTREECEGPGLNSGRGFWVDNDRKELLTYPDASYSATDTAQYIKNLRLLALDELSGRFGPEGNAIRTGVFVDSLNAENTYMSWGLFEDLVINSFFGFGADIEKINEGKNFSVRLDSSNSFTSWNQEYQSMQRTLFSVPESPPKAVYPSWWGNGDPDYTGGVRNGTTILRNGSYTYQQRKRPFDYKAKQREFAHDMYSGTKPRATEFYDLAAEDKTADGVIIDHSEIDKYFNRIPLREVFINTDVILGAFNANKSIKKVLEDILGQLNEDSAGVFEWKLITGNSDSEFKVVDMHYLQSNEELKSKMLKENPNSGLLDLINDEGETTFFTFNIMSENSIVTDYNLEFKLPDNAIGNMYAIAGMSHDTSIFPVDDQTEQVAGITSLDEQHNRIIYEPDNGSYRIEQIDSNKNEAVKFNIYQTIEDFTSTDYFAIGGEMADNVIVGNMTGSNAANIKDKTKKKQGKKKDKKPTTAELIKVNDELMVSMGMQVASSFSEYYKFINIGNSIHDQRPNLLPYTLTLKTYGIASIQPGDTFRVDYLPVRHLNNTFLQVMKVKHDIGSNGWYTELETQYRLLPHKKSTVYKNYSAKSAEKVRLSASILSKLKYDNGLYKRSMSEPFKLDLLTPAIINGRLKQEPYNSTFNFSYHFKTRDNFSDLDDILLKKQYAIANYTYNKNILLLNGQNVNNVNSKRTSQIGVRFKDNAEMISVCNDFFGEGMWGSTKNYEERYKTETILKGKVGADQIGATTLTLPPVIFKNSNRNFEIVYLDGHVGILDKDVPSYQKTREFFQTHARITYFHLGVSWGTPLGVGPTYGIPTYSSVI